MAFFVHIGRRSASIFIHALLFIAAGVFVSCEPGDKPGDDTGKEEEKEIVNNEVLGALKSVSFEKSVYEIDLVQEGFIALKTVPEDATIDWLQVECSDNTVLTMSSSYEPAGINFATYAPGEVSIKATVGELTAECTVKVNIPEFSAMDMGLSVKWANMNVGSASPEDFGNYFSWAETIPWSRERDYKYIYKEKVGTIYNFFYTKYTTQESKAKDGKRDYITTLESQDDAATINHGSGWRTPTKAEAEELLEADNLIWEWTQIYGIWGYKIKSSTTGNCIFFPLAGSGDSPVKQDDRYKDGRYWTSTLNVDDNDRAYTLVLLQRVDNPYVGVKANLSIISDRRYDYGFSVRGVTK